MEAAVGAILSGDLSVRLTRDGLHSAANLSGVPPNDLYNALLLEVTKRFLRGELSFEDADGVANDVWECMTSDMVDLGDAFEMAEPAYSIYQAFDDGEWGRVDGEDPVEQYTRPELGRLLMALEDPSPDSS